jgi:predicted GNAT family acetyltransferase
MQELHVEHRPEARRYELHLGDELVGFADYVPREGGIAITHTEVAEEHEGQGFGTRLAEAALDDARDRGLEVDPVCPFVAHFMQVHPEYERLRRNRR